MTPGPVRWSWIAASVPSETYPAGVRFRGRMSEAEGFLCSTFPASLAWPAGPGPVRVIEPRISGTMPRSQTIYSFTVALARLRSWRYLPRLASPARRPVGWPHPQCSARPARPTLGRPSAPHPPAARRTVCRPHPDPAGVHGSDPPHGASSGDSWQRIDGVSRLLPYSDLLALTSSSRRGEAWSDRGSWKRLRILQTGASRRSCGA